MSVNAPMGRESPQAPPHCQAQQPICPNQDPNPYLDVAHKQEIPLQDSRVSKHLLRFGTRLGLPKKEDQNVAKGGHALSAITYVPLTLAERVQLPDDIRRGLGLPHFPPYIKALCSDLPVQFVDPLSASSLSPTSIKPSSEVVNVSPMRRRLSWRDIFAAYHSHDQHYSRAQIKVSIMPSTPIIVPLNSIDRTVPRFTLPLSTLTILAMFKAQNRAFTENTPSILVLGAEPESVGTPAFIKIHHSASILSGETSTTAPAIDATTVIIEHSQRLDSEEQVPLAGGLPPLPSFVASIAGAHAG